MKKWYLLAFVAILAVMVGMLACETAEPTEDGGDVTNKNEPPDINVDIDDDCGDDDTCDDDDDDDNDDDNDDDTGDDDTSDDDTTDDDTGDDDDDDTTVDACTEAAEAIYGQCDLSVPGYLTEPLMLGACDENESLWIYVIGCVAMNVGDCDGLEQCLAELNPPPVWGDQFCTGVWHQVHAPNGNFGVINYYQVTLNSAGAPSFVKAASTSDGCVEHTEPMPTGFDVIAEDYTAPYDINYGWVMDDFRLFIRQPADDPENKWSIRYEINGQELPFGDYTCTGDYEITDLLWYYTGQTVCSF